MFFCWPGFWCCCCLYLCVLFLVEIGYFWWNQIKQIMYSCIISTVICQWSVHVAHIYRLSKYHSHNLLHYHSHQGSSLHPLMIQKKNIFKAEIHSYPPTFSPIENFKFNLVRCENQNWLIKFTLNAHFAKR